jgi:hypothetical protein
MPKYTVLLPLILRPPLPHHYRHLHPHFLVIQPHAARVHILCRHRHWILHSPTTYTAILLKYAPKSLGQGDGPLTRPRSDYMKGIPGCKAPYEIVLEEEEAAAR